MSYPQPDSNRYATNGYPFFRLNTPLVSPGDIYESEQGATAFAIGPESDIANVRIFYLDDQLTPTLMNDIVVGADRAVAGLVYARLDAEYLPSMRPGRVFFAIDDIYDPNFKPSGWETGNPLEIVQPNLDVIQYFNQTSNITAQRNDRRFYYELPVVTGDQSLTFLVLPYYGRRYASICIANRQLDEGDSYFLTITGVNYLVGPSGEEVSACEVVLVDAMEIAAAQTVQQTITAGQHGMFDAIVVLINDTAGSPVSGFPAAVRIVFSDNAESST